jgi:hypothetical protein
MTGPVQDPGVAGGPVLAVTGRCGGSNQACSFRVHPAAAGAGTRPRRRGPAGVLLLRPVTILRRNSWGAGNNGPASTATASSFLNAAGTIGG